MSNIFIVFFMSTCCLSQVFGHGYMYDPPSRSNVWKFFKVDNKLVLANFKRNGVMCGGFKAQWNDFAGKCGVCGDPFNATHPQDNENTGKYGRFGPVKNYTTGDNINIKINLTANHYGKFRYSLCVLEDPTRPETGEGCFKPLNLEDGKDEYIVNRNQTIINNIVKLPDMLQCQRCVLRWEYIAGNKKGICADGKKRKGCGPQTTFRNCADISIN